MQSIAWEGIRNAHFPFALEKISARSTHISAKSYANINKSTSPTAYLCWVRHTRAGPEKHLTVKSGVLLKVPFIFGGPEAVNSGWQV